MSKEIEDQTLYRYLLDDLPEADELALERELFANDETFERLWAAENDLVDRYARGRLAPGEAERFENYYLSSPLHRERLALARDLARGAEAERAPGTSPGRTARVGLTSLSGFSRSNTVWWMAAAAMVLLATTILWFVVENGRQRAQVNRLEEERAARQEREQNLEKEVADERERRDQLADEIERLRTQRAASPAPQDAPRDTPSAARAVVAVLLSPLRLRGEDPPAAIRLTPDTDELLLRMRVEAMGAQLFHANVRTVEGAAVWRRGGLKARAEGGKGLLVSVRIPASKLPAGDYILTLSAGSARAPEEINRYFFRVTRP